MKQLTVLVAVVGALAGCGPVRSTAKLIDAEANIEAARTGGAEKRAPYEWTAANLYLHKAREEVGYSNYDAGVDFAQKASDCAEAARLKATKRQDDKTTRKAVEACQPEKPREDAKTPKDS
jgi:Domain of unknown function (DUF4398)